MQADVSTDRDKYLGGSDIPALLGISPYKTRWELLQEKAGMLEQDSVDNEYTKYGNEMEPKIRDYASKKLATNFVEGRHIIEDDILPTRIHTDGENDTNILEIKTTSHIYENVEDYKIYLSQLLFYMMNEGKNFGVLAVYERPEDFSEEFDSSRLNLYYIKLLEYNDYVDLIQNEVAKFKNDLEMLINNPFLTEQELIPSNVYELAEKIEESETKIKQAENFIKDYKRWKDELYTSMSDYFIKRFETVKQTKITRVDGTGDKEETKTEFDLETFKKENPKIYEKYLKTKKVIKKGRKGYVKITFKEG